MVPIVVRRVSQSACVVDAMPLAAISSRVKRRPGIVLDEIATELASDIMAAWLIPAGTHTLLCSRWLNDSRHGSVRRNEDRIGRQLPCTAGTERLRENSVATGSAAGCLSQFCPVIVR
jgi:hypothetical protein